MLIFAGEDVGLADPQRPPRGGRPAPTPSTAWACRKGASTWPRRRSTWRPRPSPTRSLPSLTPWRWWRRSGRRRCPATCRTPAATAEGFGHGEGYLYPHAYRDHWVAQQYLPDALQGKVFYQPSEQGYERTIKEQVERRREAQLAAMVEGDALAPAEVLTSSPQDRTRDRWLQRVISGASEQLARCATASSRPSSCPRHASCWTSMPAPGCSPGRRCGARRRAASGRWPPTSGRPRRCASRRRGCPSWSARRCWSARCSTFRRCSPHKARARCALMP